MADEDFSTLCLLYVHGILPGREQVKNLSLIATTLSNLAKKVSMY